MTDEHEERDQECSEQDDHRVPWRWQRIKMAAGDDALAAAARQDLAAEAEHSHRRHIKGA